MNRNEIARRIRNRETELRSLGVRRLALFGSAARNENRPGSDLDFVVEFEGAPTFDRYIELQFLLEDLFERQVDLVTADSLREPLRARIEREAIDLTGLPPVSH